MENLKGYARIRHFPTQTVVTNRIAERWDPQKAHVKQADVCGVRRIRPATLGAFTDPPVETEEGKR